MDSKSLEVLRDKYIQNPPEGMTAKLVKGMPAFTRAFLFGISPKGEISYYTKKLSADITCRQKEYIFI